MFTLPPLSVSLILILLMLWRAMRRLALVPALATVVLLVACATTVPIPPAPQTPSQGLYEAKVALDVAIKQADAYAKLPRCATGGPTICSTTVIAQNLYTLASKANDGFNAAQTAVTLYQSLATPGASDLQKALAAVSAAASAVQQLVGATTVLQKAS